MGIEAEGVRASLEAKTFEERSRPRQTECRWSRAQFALCLAGLLGGCAPEESSSTATVSAFGSRPLASAEVGRYVPSEAPLLTPTQLGRHTASAHADIVGQLSTLRVAPVVRQTFPPAVQRIIEEADIAVLYSVGWHGAAGLEAILDGTALSRDDVFGRLTLLPQHHVAVVSWLYEGMRRPFGGMRCDSPHHAFLFRKGHEAVAIAVCFECGTIAIQGAHNHRASVRWDPAFRDYLRAHLLASGIPDVSTDARP